MTGQMTTLFHILIAFFKIKDIHADKNSCSVYWTTSSPLILGNNITLECTFIGERCTGTYKWVGGPTNNVLTLKNSVLDHVKYSIDVTIDRRYDLVIKNLSMTDLNVSYVCHCGFYNYVDVLRQSSITTNCPQDTTHYSVYEDKVARTKVLQKDNNLVMVICYDHTCSGNERWDNGTTSLHLNGPNGTNIMQGSYDIESNGSCLMLTIKDAKPKDYVQQYQFTKGTTPITISPLSTPILSNQHHIESCVDGLESYELNLTVKHNSKEAVFHVTEPKVDLTVTNMEIVPGFYESKIHMLYCQNGTNESSNGQNVTIQLMYTTRKDTDIIVTKQIADLKCPLILPGITEDASSTLIYILVTLVCIVIIVVVVIIYCKRKWINVKFRKFRKKDQVNNDELENLNKVQTNGANLSNVSAKIQNGTIPDHQKGIN